MNFKHTLVALGATLSLAACAQIPNFSLMTSLTEATITSSNSSTLSYIPSQSFDEMLAGAFKADLPKVTVNLKDKAMYASELDLVTNASSLQALFKQNNLARWVAAVQGSGGYVKRCETQAEEMGIIGTLLGVADVLLKIRNYSIYLMAKDYDALIYTKADDASLVDHVEFRTRTGNEPGC